MQRFGALLRLGNSSAADSRRLGAEPSGLEREAMFRRNVAVAYGIRYVLKEEVGASLYRDDLSHV